MLRKLTFILLALTLLLAACAPAVAPTPAPTAAPTEVPAQVPTLEPTVVPTVAPTPATAALTFTDGLGNTIKLAGPAQKIVSLAPSNTEILFAVGAGSQVAAADNFSDYPEAAKTLPKIGDMTKYDFEQIVALKPDLVLAAEINNPEVVKSLQNLGLTVFYLNNPATLEEMYANLEIVAQLTGHETETAQLVDSLKKRVAAVDEKIAPLSSRFGVFYELDSTDPAKPWTAGKGTFITLLIDRAGGYNIASDLEAYPQMSLEQIVAADPQYILLGDSTWGGVTVEAVAKRPGWENLGAVKNGKVFPFDDNLVSRPGPRLVDGLEALAKLLRPELFK